MPTPLEIYRAKADLATRSDLAVLKANLERRMDNLERRMEVVKADLGRQIESVKADLIKWTFAFWIGNIAVISGIVFAIVRLSIGR